jgi:hypothetical protein
VLWHKRLEKKIQMAEQDQWAWICINCWANWPVTLWIWCPWSSRITLSVDDLISWSCAFFAVNDHWQKSLYSLTLKAVLAWMFC